LRTIKALYGGDPPVAGLLSQTSQSGVQAVEIDQPVVPFLSGRASFIQHADDVGPADRLQPVGYNSDSAIIDQGVDDLLDLDSFSGSRKAVASSRRTTGAFLRRVRVLEMRCCSPANSVRPPSPIGVHFFSGNTFKLNKLETVLPEGFVTIGRCGRSVS